MPRLGLVEVSAERAALIRGLFELAAWVADHPELPLPNVHASVYTGSDGWESQCRVVDAVAAALGPTAAPTPGRAGTRYGVEAMFGPVRLFSVAITDAEHAAYDVAGSYIGAVTSDDGSDAPCGRWFAMRRPTLREGEILPWVGLAGAAALPLGVLAWGHPAALWLVAIGVLLLVTFALVAWRLVLGVAVSTGLWLLGVSWALWSLPARTVARRTRTGRRRGVDLARVRSYWPWTLTFGLVVLAGTALAVRRGRTGSRGTVRRWGAPVAAQRRGGVELAGVPGRVVVRAAPPGAGC